MLIQNAPPPLRWGGGVPAGGTAHAGHGYYSTIITPYTVDCGNSTGLFQPSRMATREEVYDYLSDKPISITPAARSFDKAALQAFFDGPLRKRIKMEQDQSGKLLEPSNETGQPLGGVPVGAQPDMGTTPTQEGAPKGEILEESPEPEIPAGSETPGSGPPPDQPGAIRRGLNIITRGAQGLATVALPIAAAYGTAVAASAAYGAVNAATGGALAGAVGAFTPSNVSSSLLRSIGINANAHNTVFVPTLLREGSSSSSSPNNIDMDNMSGFEIIDTLRKQEDRASGHVPSLVEKTRTAASKSSSNASSPTDNIKTVAKISPKVADLQMMSIEALENKGRTPESLKNLLQATPESGGTNTSYHTATFTQTPLNQRGRTPPPLSMDNPWTDSRSGNPVEATVPGAFPVSANKSSTFNFENERKSPVGEIRSVTPEQSSSRDVRPVTPAILGRTPKKVEENPSPESMRIALNAFKKGNIEFINKSKKTARKIYNSLTAETAAAATEEMLKNGDYVISPGGLIIKATLPRAAKKK